MIKITAKLSRNATYDGHSATRPAHSPSAAFACLGDTLPSTAPSTIHISGRISYNALNPTALGGAEVLASHTGTDTLAADTSDTAGLYALTISTGGTPVSGYLQVKKSTYLSSYAYPARPLAADAVNNVLLITSSEFAFLANLVGVTPVPGDGFIGVIVKDCQGNPIAGATVTTSPAGTYRYDAGSTPSSTATSTSADGVAYVANVTAGNVTVQANAGGHALRQHVVNALADAVTLTEIQP